MHITLCQHILNVFEHRGLFFFSNMYWYQEEHTLEMATGYGHMATRQDPIYHWKQAKQTNKQKYPH